MADNQNSPSLASTIALHPYNNLFPMMTGNDLDELAESIKAVGLINPIVLDKNGVLLDGKYRLRACELAGAEPRFTTFEGDDAACERFITSMNVLRTHRGPSQKAIADALLAYPGCYWEHRVLPEARIVAQHPDLADSVVQGIRSLSEAYAQVLECEKSATLRAEAAIANRRRLEDLRKDAPYLAHQVDEGTLSLVQAEEAALAPVLAEQAEAIRVLGRRVVEDAIEIGRRLAECKEMLGHGDWLPWLEREFQWSERTARNFMQMHELSMKSANIAELDLPLTGFYLLAAPSTSEAVRNDVLARAEAGETFSVADGQAADCRRAPRSLQTAVERRTERRSRQGAAQAR